MSGKVIGIHCVLIPFKLDFTECRVCFRDNIKLIIFWKIRSIHFSNVPYLRISTYVVIF